MTPEKATGAAAREDILSDLFLRCRQWLAWRRFFASQDDSESPFFGEFESFWEAHRFARRHTDQVGCNEGHINWQCAQSDQPAALSTLENRLEAVARPGIRVARLGGRLPTESFGRRLASAKLKQVSWIELPMQSSAPPSVSVRLGGIAECDVLLVEGALPYWSQDLQAELIDHDARPAHLLLDSLTLTDATPFFTLHKVGARIAPYRVDNAQHLIAQLSDLGYRLKKRWRNKEIQIDVPLANCRAELSHGMHFHYSGTG